MQHAHRSRSRDPVIERLNSVRISQRDREHAREMLERSDRVVEALFAIAASIRGLFAPSARVARR